MPRRRSSQYSKRRSGGNPVRFSFCSETSKCRSILTEKSVPPYLADVWQLAADCLKKTRRLIVVGYSLPLHDQLVRGLLCDSLQHGSAVHVLDPDDAAVRRFK